MGVNYDRLMESVIASLAGRRPRLLLHCCCAPCASAALARLDPHFELSALYYNPNIAPAQEHEKRLGELRRLTAEMPLTQRVAVLAPEYEPERFLEAARGLEDAPEGGARCEACFTLRLGKTCEIARAEGCQFVATSLTVGPMKRADTVNRIGQMIAQAAGLVWLPADFKKRDGYRQSIELSNQYGLYRQNYCGCGFSRRNVNQ